MMSRRTMIMGAAGLGVAGAAGLGAFGSGSRPDNRWTPILKQTAAFESAARRRGFIGSWDSRWAPMKFSIDAPATEGQVARVEEQIGRVEEQIGRDMPKSLRAFFLDCSAAIDIAWLLPGRRTETPEGLTTVRYELIPPQPFTTDKGSTLMNSGGLTIRLADVADGWTGREMWRRSFLEAAEAEKQDEAARAHYEVYARFWERGFPVTTNGGGDVVAIDMQDPQERMLLSFHDGSDEPGWLLGHDLHGMLDHLSRLGFPGFEIYLLTLFKDETLSEATDAAFQAAYGDRETVKRHGLAPASAVAIDADSPNGKAWRAWVGVDT